MPITSVTKNPEELTMQVVADFAVPVRRLWDAYADPRELERFWGPPQWPATFTRHDMAAGGESHYSMTGPDGERNHGYWRFLSVDEGKAFEVTDGFATAPGEPDTNLPAMRMTFEFEPTADGSRLTTTTYFDSLDQLTQLLDMGMEQGMSAAMAQIDDVLADLASFAAGGGTRTQLIDDTHVRVSRVIRGTVEQVWHAHHEPALVQRWLLGPDGWTMPVCEIAEKVGDDYRYEWQQDGGDGHFGFTGHLRESLPGVREVTTERMIGTDGPGTVNELTLTAVDGGTLLSLLITYPSVDVRDAILATGMTDGMESSYARLETEVLDAA